jgi:uncharacterized membrane protein SpoIIM required for sporulation
MVSSAIVISVQATTIRSANLMASFVVVPVAFLLQGETVLIFWGNEDVLWYAIAGVTLLSGLLVRLGLAHFKREYLLGREIDTLNFKSMYRVFRNRFVGEAESFRGWYRVELPRTLRQLRQPLAIVLAVGLISIVASYAWVVVNVPAYVDSTPARAEEYRTLVAKNIVNLDGLDEQLPPLLLFFYNTRTMIVFLLAGLFSFGTLGLTLFMVNFVLVGGVLGAADLVGFSPLLTFAVGILPHGIFELTAVILATAAMLKVGAQLVSTNTDKSLGETLILSLADWSKVFVGLVIPLLAIAAVVEIYVTPVLIKVVFPQL